MNIRDAVKTSSKIFTYDKERGTGSGFITNGTWITWVFDYGEGTLIGRADQEMNLDLEPEWHEVTEGTPEEYHNLVKFVFQKDILIEA